MDPSYRRSVCVCVFIKLHMTAQPGPVKLIFQCYSSNGCVCVHHINRSGPNLMIIHLEYQNAVADPVRGLLDRMGKGNNKRSRPGVRIAKMNAKTITPESEIRNIQSSSRPPLKNNKTKQKHKTSEMIIDTNNRER